MYLRACGDARSRCAASYTQRVDFPSAPYHFLARRLRNSGSTFLSKEFLGSMHFRRGRVACSPAGRPAAP